MSASALRDLLRQRRAHLLRVRVLHRQKGQHATRGARGTHEGLGCASLDAHGVVPGLVLPRRRLKALVPTPVTLFLFCTPVTGLS